MAITAERKAQLDAIISQQKGGQATGTSGSATSGGISPERKAQLDAIIAQHKTAQQPQEPGGFQKFVQGVAKPFLKVATNVANFGEGTLDLLKGDVKGANEATTKARDFGYFGQDVTPVGVDEGGQFKNIGGFAKDVIGTGAEIGAYAMPASGALRGVKSVAEAGLKALPRVAADQALLGGASAFLGGAGQEAQRSQSTTGSILGAGAKAVPAGAAIGAVLPIAGTAVRGATKFIGKGIGKGASEILGRTTGMQENVVKNAFNDPNVVKFSRRAAKEGPEGLMTEALEDTRNALDSMVSENSAAYREAIDRVNASPQDMSNTLSDIRSKIVKDATEGFGIRFNDGKKLNNLDFNASDVVEGTASVQRAFDRMFGESISTVKEMDRLKKSLGRIAKGAPNGSPAQALIYRMKDQVSTSLKEGVPGYAEEMARFGSASELIDDIEKALSLKDTVQKDTAIRKLMSTMRQNNEFRLEMLKILEQKGKGDITAKISGATAANWTPRGLAGVLSGVLTPSGISLSVINPANIPYLMLWLSISSPRLVTEAAALLGKFKGKTIPAVVKQQFRNILIRAASEATSSEDDPGNIQKLPQPQYTQ